MGNCACCGDDPDAHHTIETKFKIEAKHKMTPFDSNVDIWMRELTKAILQEMIEKAVGI
jgi:hypothetical protein